MKTKPIVDVRITHSAGKGTQSVVGFNRKNRGMREYIPTTQSVRRLALWLDGDMFLHSFEIGTHIIKVFVTPRSGSES